jgi:hypothetical protein
VDRPEYWLFQPAPLKGFGPVCRTVTLVNTSTVTIILRYRIFLLTALTNIYSCFDSKTLYTVTDTDKEGRRYVEDVVDKEKDIGQGCKLSKTFGSILGDIGLYITYFEERRAVLFEELLDCYKKID